MHLVRDLLLNVSLLYHISLYSVIFASFRLCCRFAIPQGDISEERESTRGFKQETEQESQGKKKKWHGVSLSSSRSYTVWHLSGNSCVTYSQ